MDVYAYDIPKGANCCPEEMGWDGTGWDGQHTLLLYHSLLSQAVVGVEDGEKRSADVAHAQLLLSRAPQLLSRGVARREMERSCLGPGFRDALLRTHAHTTPTIKNKNQHMGGEMVFDPIFRLELETTAVPASNDCIMYKLHDTSI